MHTNSTRTFPGFGRILNHWNILSKLWNVVQKQGKVELSEAHIALSYKYMYLLHVQSFSLLRFSTFSRVWKSEAHGRVVSSVGPRVGNTAIFYLCSLFEWANKKKLVSIKVFFFDSLIDSDFFFRFLNLELVFSKLCNLCVKTFFVI